MKDHFKIFSNFDDEEGWLRLFAKSQKQLLPIKNWNDREKLNCKKKYDHPNIYLLLKTFYEFELDEIKFNSPGLKTTRKYIKYPSDMKSNAMNTKMRKFRKKQACRLKSEFRKYLNKKYQGKKEYWHGMEYLYNCLVRTYYNVREK